MKKSPKKNSRSNEELTIAGIGASAGGLEALEQFFKNMPALAKKELAFQNEELNKLITESKEAEKELFKREQESRAMVENNPDIVGRFDKKFRYLYINRPIYKGNNSNVEDIIGKTIHERGFSENGVSVIGKCCQYANDANKKCERMYSRIFASFDFKIMD